MKARKSLKISDKIAKSLKAAHRWIYLKCKECRIRDVRVDDNVKEVICAVCTSKKVSAPEVKKKVEKSTRPAGWRFMAEFVDADGTVYFYGEEQAELKGTMTISDIQKIKSEQKHKRIETKKKREFRNKLKDEKLVKEYEKKKTVKKKDEEKKQKQLDEKSKEPEPEVKKKKHKIVKTKKQKIKKTKIKPNRFFD